MTLDTALNRFANHFVKHWLAFVIGVLLLYSLLPFLGPVLKKAGLETGAQVIYQPYKLLCHTYGFRSLFLFGDQLSYPRGTGAGMFDTESGLDTRSSEGILASRAFQGNERMGYKVALCERDVAIYLSMALNGVAFAWVRKRARPLPWWLFVLVGLVPIGLDGFSQLLSQPPFNLFAYRESTLLLRALTGGLFGASVAWLIFPIVQGMVSGEQ